MVDPCRRCLKPVGTAEAEDSASSLQHKTTSRPIRNVYALTMSSTQTRRMFAVGVIQGLGGCVGDVGKVVKRR